MRSGLPISHQIAAMRATFRDLLPRWHAGKVRWTGPLMPSPVSSTYTVEVSYRLGRAPTVRVLSPEVRDRGDGQPIPHVYPGNRPCLYLPRTVEWTPSMRLADTTVVWLCLWLRFYETWLNTGTWHGEGEHPNITPRRPRRMGRRYR